MATKDKKPAAKKSTSQTKVTRITASDIEKSVTKAAPTKTKKTPTVKAKKVTKAKGNGVLSKVARPFVLLGGYFKGAWYELNQVTWPNRKATWSLTLALLAFTAFFVVMILLLDAMFKYLLEMILG